MHDAHLESALRAVRAAAVVARAVQADLDRVRQITKDDRSPVTVADFAVQAIVAMELNDSLNGTHIVGEEHGDDLRSERGPILQAVVDAVRCYRRDASTDDVIEAIDSCDHDGSADAYWALDPVDGTKGFLRGQQYAIALGRIEDGRVVMGVMGCPNLPGEPGRSLTEPDPHGCLYAAALGNGAWEYSLADPATSPKRVQCAVYRPGDPVRTCESVEKSHSKQDDTARIVEELGGAGKPARLDSQCKYAIVARGQADAYLRLPTRADYREKIWDHAAGKIIAEEAGAEVSDVFGRKLDFTHGPVLEINRGVVCAAPGLHGEIIRVIERLGIAAATAG